MFGLSVREGVCVCCVQSLGSFRAQIGVDCPQTGVDWVELGSFGQYTPVFGRMYPGVYFSIHTTTGVEMPANFPIYSGPVSLLSSFIIKKIYIKRL